MFSYINTSFSIEIHHFSIEIHHFSQRTTPLLPLAPCCICIIHSYIFQQKIIVLSMENHDYSVQIRDFVNRNHHHCSKRLRTFACDPYTVLLLASTVPACIVIVNQDQLKNVKNVEYITKCVSLMSTIPGGSCHHAPVILILILILILYSEQQLDTKYTAHSFRKTDNFECFIRTALEELTTQRYIHQCRVLKGMK